MEIARVTGRIEGKRVEIEDLFTYQNTELEGFESAKSSPEPSRSIGGSVRGNSSNPIPTYTRGLGDLNEIFN